jgi:hypothetical protein
VSNTHGPLSFQNAATGAGRAGGAAGANRQSCRQRQAAPVRAGTKRRSRAPPGLRHAAAGLQGSDAPPARPRAGAPTPTRIRAATILSARPRCGRHRRPDKNRTLAPGRARAGGVRALARAPAAARASRPGKCATRAPATCKPWRRRRRATARAPHPRSATGTCRPPIPKIGPASAIKTRRAETAERLGAAPAACERDRAEGVRRPGTNHRDLMIYARATRVPNGTEQVPSRPIQALFPTSCSDQT